MLLVLLLTAHLILSNLRLFCLAALALFVSARFECIAAQSEYSFHGHNWQLYVLELSTLHLLLLLLLLGVGCSTERQASLWELSRPV